ncbi:hypothetical protein [Halobaculum limi]|uniref:hypothetical protein n=1 Tax=Halobaculum limi TaxID=3031916 RepID=UPI00240579A7|nr:hypothetical protein [Halobaculum sp. YSMS11]
MANDFLDRSVQYYRRYGPGRLPFAGRRDVGGGYAGVYAALGGCLLFALVTAGLDLLSFGTGFLGVAALLALPFVLPAAFLAGALTWRVFPTTVPRFGTVAGVVAATLAYVLAGTAFAVVFAVAETGRTVGTTGKLVAPEVATGVFDALGFGGLVALTALLVSAWLVVPIGALVGSVHERSQRVHAGAR